VPSSTVELNSASFGICDLRSLDTKHFTRLTVAQLASGLAGQLPFLARAGDPAQGDHPPLAGVGPQGQRPGTAGGRREGLM